MLLQNHYRNLAITFFICLMWSVYVFFDYFTDHSFLKGLTLLYDYLVGALPVLVISMVIAVLRFTKYRNIIINSFWYTFGAYSNLFLVLVYSLYIIVTHSVREFLGAFELGTILYISHLLFGLGLFFDLYRNHVSKSA